VDTTAPTIPAADRRRPGQDVQAARLAVAGGQAHGRTEEGGGGWVSGYW
jgi:hypothetical protein